MARYPDYICQSCLTTHGTKTRDGRKITYSNQDFTGGFVSWTEGDTEPGEDHTCYVSGVRCCADEARFGGIVISPDPDTVGGGFP
jgi:hypothetical protein